MANDSPTAETHVNVPVLHPSGDVHNIAVEPGTSLDELHSALFDYYHPGPTEGGALENQDGFRKAAREAIYNTEHLGREQGFVIEKTNAIRKVPSDKGNATDIPFSIHPDTDFATLHVHPGVHQSQDMDWRPPIKTQPGPAPHDVADAVKTRIPFYVADASGLWVATPDGKISKVFDKGWADQNYKAKK
jgi:hypothetical protein